MRGVPNNFATGSWVKQKGRVADWFIGFSRERLGDESGVQVLKLAGKRTHIRPGVSLLSGLP